MMILHTISPYLSIWKCMETAQTGSGYPPTGYFRSIRAAGTTTTRRSPEFIQCPIIACSRCECICRFSTVVPLTRYDRWDDSYIYQGQPQGIYYEITGAGPSGTRVAFEFYLSHYHGSTQYYHYTVEYDSANPGVFIVKYYQVSDSGSSATVGMQDCEAHAPCFQFSSY